ncbi:MAG: 3'-5' exonuclease, partial [Tissierellia bacterium]|nr:3'-5' exonuclease [Tissierellia bacterium]
NYRTVDSVIETINELFEPVMENYQGLIPHRKGKDPITQLNGEEELIFLCKELLTKEDPEEIAILTRSNQQLQELDRRLQEEGIPTRRYDKTIKDHPIIQMICQLLTSIYRKDLMAFLGFLNGDCLNLPFDWIVKILLTEKDSLDEVMDLEWEDPKWIDIRDFYRRLQNYKEQGVLWEVIEEIIHWIQDRVNLSIQDHEIVMEFLTMAYEFHMEGHTLLEDFIDHLDQKVLEEDRGIQLLTIHRSKGLEFNQVILFGMDKNLNLRERGKYLLDEEYGLAIKSEQSDAKFQIVNRKLEALNRKEELRVLYVAMTRAKDRLFLYGDFEKPGRNSYFNLLSPAKPSFTVKKPQRIKKDQFKQDLSIEYVAFSQEPEFLYRDNFSVTDFINFRLDPLAYYDRLYRGKEDPLITKGHTHSMDPRKRGNMVHFFAQYYKKEPLEPSIDKLFHIFEEEITKEKREEIYRLCQNYLDLNQGKAQYKELEFYYVIEEYLIRGFIDQINEGPTIIDLKTSDLPPEEMRQLYEPQLLLYSKMYQEIQQTTVQKAQIYSLYRKEIIDIDLDPKKMDQLMEEFRTFIKFTTTHRKRQDYRNFSF